MDLIVLQVLNGLSFAMLLFLLASGLSLIFGLMNLVNLAHGSFYLIAGYIALTAIKTTGNFLEALLSCPCVVVPLLGVAVQKFFLSPHEKNELAQVLVTFGFIFIFGDACLWIWGGLPRSLPKPSFLNQSIFIGDIVFTGCLPAIYNSCGIHRGVGPLALSGKDQSRFHDQGECRQFGYGNGNGGQCFKAVHGCFCAGNPAGCSCRGLGRGLCRYSPWSGFGYSATYASNRDHREARAVSRGHSWEVLLCGDDRQFRQGAFPEISLFMVFAPMAVVLAVRPQGLFGTE